MKKVIFVIGALMGMAPAAFGQLALSGKMHHEFTAAPGQTIRGEIKIYNKGDMPRTALIQIKDLIQAGQTCRFPDPGRKENPRSNAAWIRLSAERIEIPARNVATIPYTVKIPKKKLAGDYYAVAVVSEEEPERAGGGYRVNLKIQLGTIIETKFTGGVPDLEFRAIQYAEKKAIVIVENTGANSYTGELAFSIGGHVFTGKRDRIFAGGTKTWIFEVDLPDGRTSAMAMIDAGPAGQWGTKRTVQIGILKKKP